MVFDKSDPRSENYRMTDRPADPTGSSRPRNQPPAVIQARLSKECADAPILTGRILLSRNVGLVDVNLDSLV